MSDLSRLCIHTETVKPLQIEEVAEKFAHHGIPGVSVWRQTLENRDPQKTGQILRDQGLEIVSLVRGGFFPSSDPGKRVAAIEENKRAIIEAVKLGASLLVLVCGSDPDQSPGISRTQIRDAIRILLPFAESQKIRLGIEPLHPMYADTRSAIITMKQANEIIGEMDSPFLGLVVDVYHTWWDENLEDEIKLAGKKGKIFAFHVSDWKVPTEDMLADRGLMGEGCIPIRQIRSWVEEAGFNGFIEVEIFSKKYWRLEQEVYLKMIIKAFEEFV
ncbi:MAG: xylose isomerase [Bacteroides sp. SM23_62_1]|nr:MAG: xylose isomerase [Bacteroides sp. SM23_62_1]